MAHLAPPTTPVPTATPFSTQSKQIHLRFQKLWSCHKDSVRDCSQDRRSVALGLVGLALSLNVNEQKANAAGRRPAPPPPQERKDPNVSGIMAKILASKKRKDAMKDSMAKLREKGKQIQEPSN